MTVICNKYQLCDRSKQCAFGVAHNYCEQTDGSSSRCFDIRPYVVGGVMVFAMDLDLIANEPIQMTLSFNDCVEINP